MHLLAWGHTGVAGRIEADMALADRLADLIAAAPALELWHRRHRSGELAPGRPRPCRCPCPPARAWISLADIAGDSWFRSVAANPLANPEPVVTAVLNALDPS